MNKKTQINFLGTGSAKPTAKRNHVGILVSFNSENILIDCGEGIQRQFKIAKLNPNKLTKILLTHWHGDHTLGLAGLLDTLAMSEYQKTLEIYGPKGTRHKISLLEKIFGKFRIKYKVYDVEKKVFDSQDFQILATPVPHRTPTNAYSITIKDKRRIKKSELAKLNLPHSPLLKKLQEGKDIVHPKTNKKIKAKDLTYLEKGAKITIVLDTALNTNAIKLAKDSDLLICESTYASDNEHLAKERSHLTSKQAATIAKKANAKKLVLLHISQRYEKSTSQLLKEAKEIFKSTTIANDFDRILL